ncbi:MAG: proteasome subunit alpha [Actinomycetia bacterium]|nr:proteasome subunit alpha [Actinomycetes bacterium]
MSVPFYVSPEQVIKDKADFAQKGIARGRSVIVMQYVGGILLVAENPSHTLHKVSEIYDKIAFAAVGKYNEFENMRVAGVRLADMRGYSYDRSDVTGRSLANAYATTLGTIFTETQKPYEVELVVAEVGDDLESDQIYRLRFDGSVADERAFVAMGGSAEELTSELGRRWNKDVDLQAALRLCVSALSSVSAHSEQIPVNQLEVAVLERDKPRRKFVRLGEDRLAEELGSDASPASTSTVAEDTPGESGGDVGVSDVAGENEPEF